MKSKASHKLTSFRDSFSPTLTQADLGKRYGVGKQYISRLELGHRNPGPKIIREMAKDGLVATSDWYEDHGPEMVLCVTCERRVEDPVCKSCSHSECPRLFWIEQHKSTIAAEKVAA